jgi:putative Holliday junction resolvase
MRALAIDHGEKRIGIAISDSTGTIARPLSILRHVSRPADVDRVLEIARVQDVRLVVIGHSTDEEGLANAAGRRAERFAEVLRRHVDIPIIMWDESLSSQDARAARIAAGVPRGKRSAPVDSRAAAVILQSYLDAQLPRPEDGTKP